MNSNENFLNKSLRYSTDTSVGFTRIKNGENFSYFDINKKKITDTATLDRIEALHIPPAWTSVWIAPYTNGHIQVTGRDEKGRKQYIYHKDWITQTQENKFNKLLSFSSILPVIRENVEKDMKKTSLSERKVLATVVWLLDNTYIRVGNEEYAKENKHFGLTTFRTDHVEVDGQIVQFHYIGKSGKEHTVEVENPKVAKIIRKLEGLPGYELFQYIDEKGGRRPVDSDSVNEYLREIGKEDITAKDFRTWGATVLAGSAFYHTYPSFSTQKEAKKNITRVTKNVSKHLRNTPSVCKTYYIHPNIFSSYTNKVLTPIFETYHKKGEGRFFNVEEMATKEILQYS